MSRVSLDLWIPLVHFMRTLPVGSSRIERDTPRGILWEEARLVSSLLLGVFIACHLQSRFGCLCPTSKQHFTNDVARTTKSKFFYNKKKKKILLNHEPLFTAIIDFTCWCKNPIWYGRFFRESKYHHGECSILKAWICAPGKKKKNLIKFAAIKPLILKLD